MFNIGSPRSLRLVRPDSGSFIALLTIDLPTRRLRSHINSICSPAFNLTYCARAESEALMLRITNLIPRSLSGESSQDSEPNLAVNPENPLQMVATAFTRDPLNGQRAPLFVSNDGGLT